MTEISVKDIIHNAGNGVVSACQKITEGMNIRSLDESQQLEEEFSDAKSDFDHFEDALAIAHPNKREDEIKKLVSYSYDINSVKNGQTILDVAIERKFPSKFVGCLIENGSKINTVDSNGCTVLHRAVKNEDIGMTNLLLQTNKKKVDEYFLAKFLPEFIFIHQIEVNALNHEGFTALDYTKQNTAIYCLLQQYGAKHSEKFMHFRSINIDKLDLNKLASDSNYCFDVISKALEISDKNSKEKTIDWLLKSGASIDVAKDGKTLLSIAAEERNVENAILLITKGAREGIHTRDNKGRTLLLNAIIQKKPCYVKGLIDSGIDVNIADNEGNTAMHHAKVGLFTSLQESGTDPYTQNNEGLTPIEYALQRNAILKDDVDYLFKMYVTKGDNSKNIQLVKKIRLASGETLLEYFIDNKLFDSAKSCINLSANVNQPLSNGSSLLTKALQNGNIEGVTFLLGNGANTNLGYGNKKKNTKLYLKVAVGCAVAFSLGMGIAATITLVQMSCVALIMTAVVSLLTVIASISLLILYYKKIKSEKHATSTLTSNANFAESAGNLFSELASIPERAVEAGALYLEVQKNIEKITEEVEYKREFFEARIQDFQQVFIRRFGNSEPSNNSGSTLLERISSKFKHGLRIYSNLPVSNLHLMSLAYNLSWEVPSAIFSAITDPTLASTIFTAIRERKWPEGKQWSEVLRNTVPNLIRNQELIHNVIVPTLVDLLQNLSQSKEERKFIIYTLVALKGVIDEVYTPSAQESLPRILGREFASNINNIVIAINDLLHSCDEKEVERAQAANDLDLLIGKLNSEKAGNLVTYLKEKVVLLTEFQGQITQQSIRKLVDYCLDPKPSDKLAAKTLLDDLRIYIQNNCPLVTRDANSNLLNPDITQYGNFAGILASALPS